MAILLFVVKKDLGLNPDLQRFSLMILRVANSFYHLS